MSITTLIQRDVQVIRDDETCSKAASAMRDANVGTLIVTTEEDVPIGIVTDRDLALRVLADCGDPDRLVRDVMTKEPIFLRESSPLHRVVETMSELRLRRMIVVDEDNRLCGVLSLDDLVLHLSELMVKLGRVLRGELAV